MFFATSATNRLESMRRNWQAVRLVGYVWLAPCDGFRWYGRTIDRIRQGSIAVGGRKGLILQISYNFNFIVHLLEKIFDFEFYYSIIYGWSFTLVKRYQSQIKNQSILNLCSPFFSWCPMTIEQTARLNIESRLTDAYSFSTCGKLKDFSSLFGDIRPVFILTIEFEKSFDCLASSMLTTYKEKTYSLVLNADKIS